MELIEKYYWKNLLDSCNYSHFVVVNCSLYIHLNISFHEPPKKEIIITFHFWVNFSFQNFFDTLYDGFSILIVKANSYARLFIAAYKKNVTCNIAVFSLMQKQTLVILFCHMLSQMPNLSVSLCLWSLVRRLCPESIIRCVIYQSCLCCLQVCFLQMNVVG